MAGFNVSAFFGANAGNDLFSSFNFTDYQSIRTGSYKKLLNKYFAESETKPASQKSDKTTVRDKVNALSTDTTGLTKMKKEADELKSSATSLSKDDLWKKNNGTYDMDRIADAVKSFADEYNDVIAQADKTGTKDVKQQVGYMESLSKTMSKALSKVGISFGEDGKMSVDADALKKANGDDVKALFSGNYSYGNQVAIKASAVNSAALRNSSLYSNDGSYNAFTQSMNNYWV